MAQEQHNHNNLSGPVIEKKPRPDDKYSPDEIAAITAAVRAALSPEGGG